MLLAECWSKEAGCGWACSQCCGNRERAESLAASNSWIVSKLTFSSDVMSAYSSSERLCKWRHVVTRSGSKKTSISRIAWIQETQDNMRSSGCSKITTVEMSQKRCLEVSNSKAAPQLIINSSFARLNAFANKTQITVGFLDSKSRSTVKVGKHCSAVLRSKSERVVMNIRKHCSVCKELA